MKNYSIKLNIGLLIVAVLLSASSFFTADLNKFAHFALLFGACFFAAYAVDVTRKDPK